MSSRKSRYDIMEIMRKKISMSQKIVAKDKEYGFYAGADLQTADKIAKIELILELGLIPKPYDVVLKFCRLFLEKRRKAFFGATASELTKLGFMLGYKYEAISAT